MNRPRSMVVAALCLGVILGCRANEHLKTMEDTRTHLLQRGCARSGVEAATPEMEKCVVSVREQCAKARPREVEECAAVVAGGGTFSPGAAGGPGSSEEIQLVR